MNHMDMCVCVFVNEFIYQWILRIPSSKDQLVWFELGILDSQPWDASY